MLTSWSTPFHHGSVPGVGTSRGWREEGDRRAGGGTGPEGGVARKDGGRDADAGGHRPEGEASTRVAGDGDCVAAYSQGAR